MESDALAVGIAAFDPAVAIIFSLYQQHSHPHVAISQRTPPKEAALLLLNTHNPLPALPHYQLTQGTLGAVRMAQGRTVFSNS